MLNTYMLTDSNPKSDKVDRLL